MTCTQHLFQAAVNGDLGVFQKFPEDEDIGLYKDKDDNTLLSIALKNGHKDLVELLFARNDVDLDINELKNGSVMESAAEKGHLELFDFLLARERSMYPDRNPLCWAAANGHRRCTEALLRQGADANFKDNSGRTPLSWAAENGHASIISQLLHSGANVESKDNDGRTPLWQAAEKGHEEAVRLLAPIDTSTLFLLVQDGKQAEIKFIMRFEPKLGQRNRLGQSALHVAVLLGRRDIARMLIDWGGEINSRDNHGMTPLQLALQRNNRHLIRDLLGLKAHIQGIMAKEWRSAYGKQNDDMMLLSGGPDGEHYIDSFEAFPTLEELSETSITVKNRLYLLPDNLNSLIWSNIPIRVFARKYLEPNKLQIINEEANKDILDISISLWLSINKYLNGEHLADDYKVSRIIWRIKRPTNSGGSWTTTVYFSTLPYGWIPEDGADLFQQFFEHVKTKWLDGCDVFEDYLAKRRLEQLRSKGANPKMIDLLANDAQKLADLLSILAKQTSEAEKFINDYCLQYNANRVPLGLLELLKNDIELGVRKRIEELDQTVRDLLNIEFAWITIHETRVSTRLGRNVMLLAYVSVFYLPLGFCAALWAIPNIADNSTRTPFILTATVVSLVTLLITFNMEKIAAIIQRGYQHCRNYIEGKWDSIASKFKQKKGKQYPSLP